MATKRIAERVADPFAGCRVDRAAGVIFNVKLCGLTSQNGRDYLPEMFRRDHGKYADALIYFNHDSDRRVENIAGRIKNPRVDADGTPRGDAHLDLDHKDVPRVLRWAEEDPTRVGFSHVAECRLAYANGRETVEALEYVESVDIVAQPATTGGLFEGKGKGGRKSDDWISAKIKKLMGEGYEQKQAIAIAYRMAGRSRTESVQGVTAVPTVKEYLDKLAPKCNLEQTHKLRRFLKEDDYGMAPMGPEAPPAEEADAEDGITAAVKAAAEKEIDECLENSSDPAVIKRCLSQLKKILHLHGDLSDEDMEDEEEDEGGEERAEESRKKKAPAGPDYPGLIRECVAEKYSPTELDLRALSAFPDLKDRTAYIREQKARVPEERPSSPSRLRLAGLETEEDRKRVAEHVNGGGGGKKDERLVWQD